MDAVRKLMQFYFITKEEMSDHYHQNPEFFYMLRGKMEIKIDDKVYEMRQGDIVLVNANKRHTMIGKPGLLAARFEIDFHMLAEYMSSMQLFFWCNSIVDKNDAYDELRKVLDQILARYFERNEKGALYLNALYFQAAHILTSNFLINADDSRLSKTDSQSRIRIKSIQNYVQANYQSQISLNDLASRLYLSNAYLSKYIKKNLGMTFVEYLNNIRLFHAVDELMYTNKNITHIALDNGFPASAAFTKAFKEAYNESPSEYRKRNQIKEKKKQETVLNEEQKSRIMEYLRYKENGEEQEISSKEECYADCKEKKTELSKAFQACSIGDAYSLLQSEVQNQVRQLKKQTGIRYVRIWNLLSRDYCFDEKEGYNFRKLDQVLDFLLENEMIPYLELGNKPSLLMYTPERSVKEERTDNSERYEFEVFERIMQELCIHLVNRYGEEHLETWYFGFWNDPALQITDEDGEYYRYFEMVYKLLKNFSEKIRVGGAGFILGYETQVCSDIFRIWRKREVWPDFLSFCSFQYISVAENNNLYGRKSIDGNYMNHQIEIMKEVMKKADFPVREIHIDEWNFTISNRNVINDSCEQGAYILKNCIDVAGEVNLMAYWHALDTYSDYFDTDSVLNGDSGLITGDGIRKPSFYAFQFLNRLFPSILCKTDHALITTNGRNSYAIVCHNFKKLTSRYVFAEEDEIDIDKISQYMEDDEALKLKIGLTNLKNGRYQIKTYYINPKNGSVQDLWKNLEYSKGLARDEIQYLKAIATPRMEMKNVQIEDGVMKLENVLEAQEIRLIEILYRYSS